MIRHLFTLIWNRKKSNFLMIAEIFFSFIVLFGVLSLVFFYFDNYRKPLGFQYEKVWIMNLSWNQEKPEKVRSTLQQLKKQLKSNPEVADVALASVNFPYTLNTINIGMAYNGRSTGTYFFRADKDYAGVMQIPLKAGRWFTEKDNNAPANAIVINQALADKIFPGEDPVGKVVTGKNDPDRKVIGVVDIFRQKGEYAADEPAFFEYHNTEGSGIEKDEGFMKTMAIRIKPGVSRDFEEKIIKQASQVAKGWTIEIKTVNELRASSNKITLIPLVIFAIICSFLIINVALGLFGVLWYNINRRISEIGLRRAIGATSGQVNRQFIGEVVVLAFFGVILGILIAAQFPLLQVFGLQTGIYLAAMGASVLLIFFLAVCCALYPSLQAAKISPAIALHEE